MQPISSGHWRRTRSCSSIQYERSRPRKNGCAGFKMVKNSRTLESKYRRSCPRLHVNFPRRAVAARENAINNPPPAVSKPSVPAKPSSNDQIKMTVPAPKKEVSVKKALKGVIVKRKPKGSGEPSLAPSPTSTSAAKYGDDAPPEAKRRKISAP